jgi:hypothetical protein
MVSRIKESGGAAHSIIPPTATTARASFFNVVIGESASYPGKVRGGF